VNCLLIVLTEIMHMNLKREWLRGDGVRKVSEHSFNLYYLNYILTYQELIYYRHEFVLKRRLNKYCTLLASMFQMYIHENKMSILITSLYIPQCI